MGLLPLGPVRNQRIGQHGSANLAIRSAFVGPFPTLPLRSSKA